MKSIEMDDGVRVSEETRMATNVESSLLLLLLLLPIVSLLSVQRAISLLNDVTSDRENLKRSHDSLYRISTKARYFEIKAFTSLDIQSIRD